MEPNKAMTDNDTDAQESTVTLKLPVADAELLHDMAARERDRAMGAYPKAVSQLTAVEDRLRQQLREQA